jgi:cytochrome b
VSRQVPQGDEALSSRPDGKILVWDLPTRLFHGLLAALVLFSWWSIKNHHSDWHLWSGFAVLTLLIFRLLWGFVGSSTARFATFVRGPRQIGAYFRGKWTGVGHNPLGAMSVLALLAALAVQVGLGLIAEDEDGLYAGPLAGLVSIDMSDAARDLHESWFNIVLALIGLHLAAILFYRLRGKPLTIAMVTGRAALDPQAKPIHPAKWWVAILCVAAAIAITRWVVAGAPPFGS